MENNLDLEPANTWLVSGSMLTMPRSLCLSLASLGLLLMTRLLLGPVRD